MQNGRPTIVNLIPSSNPAHPLLKRLPEIGEVFHRDRMSEEEFAEVAPHADVLVSASNLRVTDEELSHYPALRMVGDFGVGFDGFDVPAIARRGLRACHTPDVLSEDVADLAIGLLLALARSLPAADAFVHAGRWPNENFPLGRRIVGCRIGIAGLGRIGKVVAERAKAFRMEVGYTSRSPKDVPWQYFESVKDLAAWCDALIVVIPATPETHHLINREVLEALGPKGFLVNIARGALVDTEALIEALRDKTIAGAALDVFEHEPHVEEGLLKLQNVVLAPHIGSATVETRDAMAELVMENIRLAFRGQPLVTPIPGTRRD